MENLRLFYTGKNDDSRGEVFTHLAYNGMDYTKAINAENPEAIVTEPFFQYMVENNYKTGDKRQNVTSSEFIQFIVDIGIFHKSLDNKKPIDENEVKKTIFNTVYKGNSVPIEVKKFYLTFLHVVDIATNRVVTNFDSITDLSTIRFNMAKIDVTAESKKKILFAETIPLLPEIVGFQFDTTKIENLSASDKNGFLDKLKGLKDMIIANPGKSAAVAAVAVAAVPLFSTLATTLGAWFGATTATTALTAPGVAATALAAPGVAATALAAPGVATTAVAVYEAPLVGITVVDSIVNLCTLFSTAVGTNFAVGTDLAVGFFNATAASLARGIPRLNGGGNGLHLTPLNTLLRDLYYVCYVGLDKFPISKDKEMKLETSKSTKFDVDFKKLTFNALNARDTPVKAPKARQYQIGFDDLYESVVTKVRYVRDETGMLRKLNDDNTMGAKFDDSELDEILKPNPSNCGSTGIKHASCEEVYKCLLSGKPETLAECLGQLSDKNMFDVARREVTNMHPKIAVQLLRTFGFKLRKEAGTNIILPCTFDEWLQKLQKSVDVQTATAIRENKKLLEYLRSVVNIVRENPAIINTNFKNGVLSDFARKSGLSIYRNPFPQRKVVPSVVDGLLFAPQQLTQSMQLPLALQIQNLNGRVNMPVMMGGGNAECPNANNLKQAFNMIFAEMEKNGKVLVDSDKARINTTIEKLGKLEFNLVRLMDDAKLFSRLHAAASVNNSSENVTLDDIVNVSNDSILKNINTQTQLSQDLINKVQMPLLQLLMK